ncbi:hypothetical protein LCGC14_2317870, partial [marine sediment metagenome]
FRAEDVLESFQIVNNLREKEDYGLVIYTWKIEFRFNYLLILSS